ncbi:chemotaxis signal transduction protein (cheW domain) [Legionella sainthelensi]|uniref:Chemotaxis signal transduction protein (CheW domain) n=1 Tax=Legionella sainthelensi TaxID=28087 RepID=A0A0W0YD80_9GAMM|nr:CheW domain-containing protein [Legionella sainthelensi]KTD54876.1 chemotaxis signal transduction protein (cheW domain) [Legionella sainthelensi]VEH37383.1 chemotaxis signal transduction protein (cheW domain) [Legionella sainthelensi]
MSTKNITVLHFLLQDIRVCIELRYVAKVLPLPLLEAVPSCPVYCAGLMNLKSKCIPVLDLAISIGLPREQIYPLNIPVLLCDNGSHQMGLIVDNILGIDEIDEKRIEVHEEFTQSNSPFFGVITLETGVSLLINIDWVFTLKLTQEINQVTNYEQQY